MMENWESVEFSESSILASQESRKRQELMQCQNELIAHFEQKIQELQRSIDALKRTHIDDMNSIRCQLSEEHAKELSNQQEHFNAERCDVVEKAEEEKQRLKKTYRRRLHDFARMVSEAESNYSVRSTVMEQQVQQLKEELVRQEARSDAKEKSLLQELLLKETRIKTLETSLFQMHSMYDPTLGRRESMALELARHVLKMCAEADDLQANRMKVSQKSLNKCLQLSQRLLREKADTTPST